MSNRYKDARVCECGFQTTHRGAWSIHTRTCKKRPTAANPVETELRERFASLEAHVADKEERIASLEAHVAAIATLEQMLGQEVENTMEARKRGRPRGEQIESCACGYVTENKGNFWKHLQICSYVVDGEKDQLRERVAVLEQQLAAALERNATLEQMLGPL